MEYLTTTGNRILVAHFPGNSKKVNSDSINRLKDTMFSKPDNVTIVTVATRGILDSAPLIYQLRKNEVSYINPIGNRILSHWRPTDKIRYIIEALAEVETEYTLCLDANDTIILNDLDNIVELMESYGNLDILYNASIWRYPPVNIDYVENRGQYGEYNYLNAGCCIGKTEMMKDFYNYAQQLMKGGWGEFDSEQYYIRKAFDSHQDKVFFDYDCRIFQIFHKLTIMES